MSVNWPTYNSLQAAHKKASPYPHNIIRITQPSLRRSPTFSQCASDTNRTQLLTQNPLIVQSPLTVTRGLNSQVSEARKQEVSQVSQEGTVANGVDYSTGFLAEKASPVLSGASNLNTKTHILM